MLARLMRLRKLPAASRSAVLSPGIVIGAAIAAAAALGAGPTASADEPPAAATAEDNAAAAPSLSGDILPLLEKRCGECHSRKKRSGRLNLSTADGLALGGESGAAIEPGDVDESWLWQRLEADDMPPDEPLPEAEKDLIRRWITAGAPELPELADRSPGADHWAYQPPLRRPVPEIKNDSRARTDVDRFIIAALESKGLALSPKADRATLIRRVSIDLTGLPPTAEEIAEFLSDPAADAYKRMVERYLNSPQYGVRWGKYWLDAVGYADSNGYFNADTDRPLAYKYRDYVVRSLNIDKPLDRFVREQIAGDELAGYEVGGDVTPEMVELLTATHMLRNSPDGTGESDGNEDEVRIDRFRVIEGALEIIGSAFLGITLQCARCHEHKFEPVTHAEYYSLQAILWPGYSPDHWAKPAERVVEVGTRAEREEHRRRTEAVDREIKSLNEGLAGFAAPLRKQLQAERLAELDLSVREHISAALETAEDDRSDEQKKLLQEHKELLEVSDDALAERFPEFRETRERIAASVAEHEKKRPAPLERISIFTDRLADPPPHHVLVRGDYRTLGEEIQPGVPAVLTKGSNHYQIPDRSADAKTTGRRSAFARWLTSPEHPTFGRSIVNRIWQYHFGTGLVATQGNFGYSGDDCSHPELLDHLVCELVDSGWSTKALHRLILRSAVYRQSSAWREEGHAADPENRLLWRYPSRRLDAEAIRDSMLAASGELDPSLGGPYVPTRRESDGRVAVDEEHAAAHRRSIYIQQRRTRVLTMLDVFDAPSIVTNCTFRSTSTIPIQSLSLLNSDFVIRRAGALSERITREAVATTDARITRAFLLTFSRGPHAEEREAAQQFLAEQPAKYAGAEDAQQRAWRDFCQMLLASNQFLYIE